MWLLSLSYGCIHKFLISSSTPLLFAGVNLPVNSAVTLQCAQCVPEGFNFAGQRRGSTERGEPAEYIHEVK